VSADADGIAELEAELYDRTEHVQELRNACDEKQEAIEQLQHDLSQERAAHERTNAELAKIRCALGVSPEFSVEPLADAIRQMREECAAHECTKAELDRISDRLIGARADYDTAISRLDALRARMTEVEAERDAAQAEVAAMRSAIIGVIEYQGIDHDDDDGCPEDDTCRCENIARVNAALKGTAGRALAARVPLWRELEKWCLQMQGHAKSPHLDHVLAKLAALDEKGTK
jgi:DNA repair exonuclease SbcCD ATPase subunit